MKNDSILRNSAISHKEATAKSSGFAGNAGINGHDGIVEGNKGISVEIDGVMYMIQARNCESVTQIDLIRMAESLM